MANRSLHAPEAPATAGDLTVEGVARSLLLIWLIWLIWWAWTQFTWTLNPADTKHTAAAWQVGVVALGLFLIVLVEGRTATRRPALR